MFNVIDIALIKNNVVLSTEGDEYELLETNSPSCLIINSLLKQLKVSTLNYAYAIHKGRCLYLRELNPILELVDQTCRFDLDKKNILNVIDIYLFNMFLNLSRLSNSSVECFVKWGKKIEWYFDINHQNNSNELSNKVLKYPLTKENEIYKQRFLVLLNHSFLDKLKTSLSLWKIENNMVYDLPVWYDTLYNPKI